MLARIMPTPHLEMDNPARLFYEDGVGIWASYSMVTYLKLSIRAFTTKANGTGLGLVLTQQIFSEHQGTIRFSSQEGRGTTFHIELPAAAHLETKA